MKRTLLFVAALLFAAGAMAQDIWLGAKKGGPNDFKVAVLSKNFVILETYDSSTEGKNNDIPSLIAGDNGEVYYLRRRYLGDLTDYTDVFKHDGTTEHYIYDCPIGEGIFLRDLFYDRDNGDIYACGTYNESPGSYYGIVIKNDQELFRFAPSLLPNVSNGIVVTPGHVFTCGGSYIESDYPYAEVWRDGQQFALCTSSGYSDAYDIVLYGEYLYVCGCMERNNKLVGALWRTSLTPSTTGTYKSLELLETVEFPSDTRCYHMCLDAHCLYIAYSKSASEIGVARYSFIDGMFVYPHFVFENGINIQSGNLVVNNYGCYSAANIFSNYIKNGQCVQANIQGFVSKIAMTKSMTPSPVYDLPFTENFEYGPTHWDYWYVEDEEANGDYMSYWHRCAGGDNNVCVRHGYHGNVVQMGDLYSPALRLPLGHEVTLRFKTRIDYIEDLQLNAIYLYYNTSGQHPSTLPMGGGDISLLYALDSNDFNEGEWKEIEIDLTPWAGEIVYLYFYYKGANANEWFIDDVEVFSTPATGIEDAPIGNLALYPNPANDIICIEGLESNTEVKIYNTLGELVKTVVVGVDAEINIRVLSAGLYVVRCGEISLRFVKE